VVADSARYLAPAADVAADFIPVVGEVFDRTFALFGEMYDNSGAPSGLNFTGQTQDTRSSSTHDFPARPS
jgi:hypothetical protein